METRSRKRQLDLPEPPQAPAKRTTKRSNKQSSSNPNSSSGKEAEAGPSQPAPPPQRARRSTRSATGRGSSLQASPAEPASQPKEELAAPQQEATPSGLPPRPLSAQRKASAQQEEPEAMAGRQPSRGEDGEDDMARHLTSANTALQGLLRKLGAGAFDEAFLSSMGGMSGGRFKNIITDLRQAEDESAQLGALTELCELLSISSEDNLTSFPVETAVPLLVQSLNSEHNPDIMLLAARALTFLADMMPNACSSIVRHGAVSSFCQRLLTIEYIDLAEQSLLALEKLSHEHAHALLQQGGLLAVLSYLDFFPTGVQRVAVGTAANMCRGLTTENAGAVQEAVPILTNLLQYQDAKVVDNACLALSHIAESYANKPHLLAMLSSGGLIAQALQLMTLSDSGTCTSQLSLSTYYSLIKLLCTCSSKAPAVAQQLLAGQLLSTIYTLIQTSALLPNASANNQAVLRSPDQLHEVIALLCELLPPMPTPQTIVTEDLTLDGLLNGSISSDSGTSSSSTTQDARAEFFACNADAAKFACTQLVPLMLQLHSATVMPHVRQLCLVALLRLLAMSTPAQLTDVLRSVRISSFAGNLMCSRDTATQAAALVLAELLMTKLPAVFKAQFLKEGVLQALRQLADKGQAQTGNTPTPTTSPAPAAGAAAAPAGQQQDSEAPADTSASRRVTRSNSRQRDSQPGTGKDTTPNQPATARASSPPARKLSGTGAGAQPSRNPFGTSPPARGETVIGRSPVPLAPTGAGASNATQFNTKLSTRAQAFIQQHFGDQGAAVDTEGIKKLKEACAVLCAKPEAVGQLLQLLAESPCLDGGEVTVVSGDAMEEEEGISVFELVNSGVVRSLIDYLKGADLTAGPSPQAALLARLRAFVKTALLVDSGTHPPLGAVLRKLQAALASAEVFPVLLSRVAVAGSSSIVGGMVGRLGGGLGGAGGSSSASLPTAASSGLGSYRSGLAALARPFKLRLCRHTTEKALKDYGNNVVLIEPLASMGTIEDFLYPRVSGGVTLGGSIAGASWSPQPAAAEASGAKASGAAGAAAGSSKAAAASTASTAAAVAARERSKSLEPGGATGTAGTGAGRSGSMPVPPASKAQPIPEDKSNISNRRMTRAAAARAQARADNLEGAAPAAAIQQDEQDEDGDMRMASGDPGAGDEGDVPGADGLFDDDDDDDDDDDYDEELEGDEDGDQDMDIGSMQVHDLHVEDVMGAALEAGGAGSARAGSGVPLATRQASAPPAPGDLSLPSPAQRLPTAVSTGATPAATAAAAAAASAAAAARAPSAWGARRAGVEAAGAASDIPASVRAEQPRLVFFSGSTQLSPSTTVFQAIQQMSIARTAGGGADGGSDAPEDAGRERHMWDGIHTLHYRAASTADTIPPTSTGMPAPGGRILPRSTPLVTRAQALSTESGLPLGTLMPIQQVQAVSLPSDLVAEPACRDLLELIKLLEVLNRLGPRLCAAAEDEEEASSSLVAPPMATTRSAKGAAVAVHPSSACERAPAAAAEDRPVYGRVPRAEFVCSKVASKLSQQLKDVLSICGGGLPAWCRQLSFACKHLLPFEVRRRHFYCTALGLGRALQHMQALHAAEAGGAPAPSGNASDRETRVGRLQRQKVRVSRKRILESAIKVMELYASQRAVLELEYFGEVGTGLGPTLEFYTLLSHDLQRRSLKLWRHEDAATPASADTPDQDDARSPGKGEGAPGDATMIAVAGTGAIALPAPIAAAAGGIRTLATGHQPSVALQSDVEAWHDDTQYVNAPWGLFPSPLAAGAKGMAKVLDMFKLLGRSIAKALQDNRLMDLPLNYAFYRAVLGTPLDMYDIASFDPGLGQQLQRMWNALVAARAKAAAAPMPTADADAGKGKSNHRKRTSAAGKGAAPTPTHNSTPPQVVLDGVPIEDLCLTFTLPGYPEYELVPGGCDLPVDSSNLGTWIESVVDATLGSGIARQLEAFTTGFNEVFPLSHLESFYEDEVEALLCGAGEAWTVSGLAKAIKFDHGYTSASPVVLALLEVLTELDAQDQRRFLRFVTGCPRLPPGGLATLQPRLTVVRKHPSGEKSGSMGTTPVGSLRPTQDVVCGGGTTLADGDLPSVMTCANYIKLPPYSCKQVLRDRLLFAIREGQGSFDLS